MRTKTINEKNLTQRVMIFKKYTRKKNSSWIEKLLIFFGIKDGGPIGRFR